MTHRSSQDEAVNAHVENLLRRYPQFRREQDEELRQLGSDAMSRLFHEHFLLRTRTAYDAMLRSMLTGAELDRLETEPTFTQAWQLFVDFCWMRKRMRLFGMIFLVVLLVLGIMLFGLWAFTELIGHRN